MQTLSLNLFEMINQFRKESFRILFFEDTTTNPYSASGLECWKPVD